MSAILPITRSLFVGAASLCATARADVPNSPPLAQRVLVLSVDGMHAVDLARFVRLNPNSSFANLVRNGFNYTSASSARPADSFPGMMAIATGGFPISTGVYFDVYYDRALWPPGITSGPTGTAGVYHETTHLNTFALDGGRARY